MVFDPYYGYGGAPSSPEKILVIVKNAVEASKVRDLIGRAEIAVAAPDLDTYQNEFDILIIAFEPLSDKERSWFHGYVMSKMKPQHKLIWTL